MAATSKSDLGKSCFPVPNKAISQTQSTSKTPACFPKGKIGVGEREHMQYHAIDLIGITAESSNSDVLYVSCCVFLSFLLPQYMNLCPPLKRTSFPRPSCSVSSPPQQRPLLPVPINAACQRYQPYSIYASAIQSRKYPCASI